MRESEKKGQENLKKKKSKCVPSFLMRVEK